MHNSRIFVDKSLNILPFSNPYIKKLFYLSDAFTLKSKQNVYKLTLVKIYYIIKNIGGGIKNEF